MIGRRNFGLGAGAAVVLAGCAGAPTRYYRLAPVAGVVGVPPVGPVVVRAIALPAYLDKDGIVQAAGAYRLDYAADDLWAEPLAGMLRTVLVQDLQQRLPGATVVASGGAIGGGGGVTVEIDVLRFDSDGGGITLDAQLAVKADDGPAPAVVPVQSHVAAGGDAAAVVAGMSGLWAGLADRIAGMVGQAGG